MQTWAFRWRLLAVLLAVAGAPAAVARPVPAGKAQIVTLGTMAGPMASAERAQPATLLRWPGGMILVDAGDGVTDQLAKAGIDPVKLRSLVITHIHADHVGGLFAMLARRYQLIDPPLTIYGPPGTRRMVDGMVAAMAPLILTSPALPGAPLCDPAEGVRVIEIGDGDRIEVEGVALRAVANSHYLSGSMAPDSARAQSLSLRFDLPGRSVVLTGDSGPDARLAELARGADFLVSSILDLDGAVAAIRASRPDAPPAFHAAARAHFAQHHLGPEDAGRLAQAAGVGRLVLTHVGVTPARMKAARAGVARSWKGPVSFARDLATY